MQYIFKPNNNNNNSDNKPPETVGEVIDLKKTSAT